MVALFACAMGRVLIPMNDVMEQKLISLGYHPDANWYEASYEDEVGTEPPTDFDAREKWPDCIHNMVNEGKCLSSWAIAISSVLSDRTCIHSKGVTNLQLSAQYLVSCDKNDNGCRGGDNGKDAFQFLIDTGTPTEECIPFVSGNDGKDGTCTNNCVKGTFEAHKCAKIVYGASEVGIKRELMTSGPMFCRFDLFKDFEDYKSGIYYKVSEQLVERDHGAKLIGWGVENSIHYWMLENSWSMNWGENGFFRIKIGESAVCTVALGCETA